MVAVGAAGDTRLVAEGLACLEADVAHIRVLIEGGEEAAEAEPPRDDPIVLTATMVSVQPGKGRLGELLMGVCGGPPVRGVRSVW